MRRGYILHGRATFLLPRAPKEALSKALIRAVLEEAARHSSSSFFHWEPHVHSTPRAPRSRGLHSRTEPRRRPRRLDRRPRGGRAGRHPRTRWTRSKRSTGPSSQGRSSATRQAGGIFSRLWRGRDLLRIEAPLSEDRGFTLTVRQLFQEAKPPERHRPYKVCAADLLIRWSAPKGHRTPETIHAELDKRAKKEALSLFSR